MSRRSCHFLTVALFAALAACTSSESATNLRTSGPPMIEQVRLNESYMDMGQYAQRRVFAFGTHPQAVIPDEVHHVDSAMAVQSMNGTGTGIRIIFGSLLVGNYLEEIQCRQVIDTDAYDRVPLGTTPDDIAKCSVPMDPGVLAESCKGPHAVCLCHLPGGCGGIAEGKPVGVLDDNQDGAADVHRFIAGAVGIKCSDGASPPRTINVPIDLNATYYQPSGFQDPPAIQGGGFNFDEMGPAIELFPAGADGSGKTPALPTNMTCGLTFDPDVVGKNNEQVCAPPNGRPAGNAPQGCDDVNIDQCNESCKPGDVSAFTFKTEPLQMLPAGGWYDGATGVDPTTDLQMVSLDGVPLDPSQIGTIQVFEGAAMTPYTQFTVVLDSTNASNSSIFIHWTSPTGLAKNTMYTVVVPTSFEDAYHVGVPMPQTFHFTTGG